MIGLAQGCGGLNANRGDEVVLAEKGGLCSRPLFQVQKRGRQRVN